MNGEECRRAKVVSEEGIEPLAIPSVYAAVFSRATLCATVPCSQNSVSVRFPCFNQPQIDVFQLTTS